MTAEVEVAGSADAAAVAEGAWLPAVPGAGRTVEGWLAVAHLAGGEPAEEAWRADARADEDGDARVEVYIHRPRTVDPVAWDEAVWEPLLAVLRLDGPAWRQIDQGIDEAGTYVVLVRTGVDR